ncbi:uncharacterized protein LOC120338850 [Styela clava]
MSICVCFVCGNKMLENTAELLYSRVRSPSAQYKYGCPFFPFLEYHDPAPGAERMSDHWSVVSCQVCKAFLTQQWDSFERTHVPINKRLYWLKRPTGCEIRQPVSQIELEEILNEHSKENSDNKRDSSRAYNSESSDDMHKNRASSSQIEEDRYDK